MDHSYESDMSRPTGEVRDGSGLDFGFGFGLLLLLLLLSLGVIFWSIDCWLLPMNIVVVGRRKREESI